MEFLFYMGRKDLIKSAIAILVIIILVVLIVNVNKLISPKVLQTAEEEQDVLGEGGVVDYGNCFDKDSSTVVFVHSNSCPHCNSMKPIIEELEEEGYGFYWAESSDSEARNVINSCFGDLLGGYVPQFICPATGKEQTGAMTKGELKKFADDCA